MHDGMPVALGYFAVSFALGIAMKNAGMTAFQGFLMSLLNLASAGEYAGVQVIASDGSLFQMALITFIANARYLLMSCSLSQKLDESVTVPHRLLIGYGVTDELFSLGISQKKLHPAYYYGAEIAAVPAWAAGTACGIAAGNILPVIVVNALSVALYGMFLAVIIPPAKDNPFIRIIVLISFLCSFLASVIPLTSSLSAGTRTIILTVLISSAAAVIRPLGEEES